MEHQRIYNFFIASPSDVSNERTLTKKIITELNPVYLKAYDATLKAITYEDNASPDIAKSVQSLIEEQLIDDAQIDCALFILWHRLGTPTEDAESGWLSELAKFIRQREKQKGRPLPIQFYIKNAPINPRDIDGLQLAKVNDFVKEFPVFYKPFASNDEFETHLRAGLANAMHTFETYHKNHRREV